MSHPMLIRPSARKAIVACAMVLSVSACVDGTLTGTGTREAVVMLAPTAEAPSAAYLTGAITQARLVARDIESSLVYGSEVFNLDPTQDEWALPLTLQLPSAEKVTIAVTIELLSTSGGSASAEWSGVTSPFAVRPGTQLEIHRVSLFRGPTDNLGITSVRFLGLPSWVMTGEVFQATAKTAGGGPRATVYFASLDGSVASVDGTGVVRALSVGTAHIVAIAGPNTDTVAIEVREKGKDGSKDPTDRKDPGGPTDPGNSTDPSGSKDPDGPKDHGDPKDPGDPKDAGDPQDAGDRKDHGEGSRQ